VVIFCLLVLTHCKLTVKEKRDALRLAGILEKASENTIINLEPIPLPFSCKSTGKSPVQPTLATQLRPADIGLTITLGDSIAAALIAKTLSLPPFADNRAYSFCGGKGYPSYPTFPYCLRQFNNDLKGYSIGDGNQNSTNAKLNVAHDGDTSYNLTSQVDILLTRLPQYPYSGDTWKHISIFIGGNDLCNSCGDPTTYTAANYKTNVEAALTKIQAEIPKSFVSLIPPPNITKLAAVVGLTCPILDTCPCKRQALPGQLYPAYIQVLYDLAAQFNAEQDDDFHVTVQPFFVNITLPMKLGFIDLSYFAIDCFHLSAKGQAAAGQAMWNNCMQAPGAKNTTWKEGEKWICPGPTQYLQ